MPKFKIVDVGASFGEFTEHALITIKDSRVYAIEPNLDILARGLQSIQLNFKERVSIHPFALAESNGLQPFFGSSQINGQIGSLKKFNPKKKWNLYLQETLKKHELKNSILVETKTVKDFLIDTKLKKIDFLKIDAQGYDIELLEEFLKNSNVKCMVLEVNTTEIEEENIYKSNNNLNSLVAIMYKFKLKIIKIVPHHDFTELNVFLAKDCQEGLKILERLKMSDCPSFSRLWSVTVKSNLDSANKITFIDLLNKITRFIFHPVKNSRRIIRILINN